MGCLPQGKAEVKISFAQYRDIYIGNIQAYARDLRSYADDIAQLTEECLENIHFETNKIEGDIEVEKDKYLCISIPYSKGWSCYVDGEKTKILKGNIMYMVVPLKGGVHHIELRYVPEGMRLGIVISFITLLGMISFASYKRVKNK
jgi:uncharacterized membrane protein YfhO